MNLAGVVRFSLAAVLLLGGAPLRAENALEIISLRHRTAEQVLPALRPLVAPGGTLTGQGSDLFVRTSPENLADLRRALEAIDRPARRLQISVRFDDSVESSSRALGASGRIGSGGSDIELRARESSRSAMGRIDQTVQVLEGGRATIYAGDSRPIRERRFIQTPGGIVSQEVTVVQDTRSGFDVVPRLAGNTVYVDIAMANGRTSASGPLGEWFLLGAVDTRSVWLKVDALP